MSVSETSVTRPDPCPVIIKKSLSGSLRLSAGPILGTNIVWWTFQCLGDIQ